MGKCSFKSGFSLIELSVVLVVIALITAMGVSAGLDSLESTKRVSTEKKMDVIEAALKTYRSKNGRLPCPGNSGLLMDDANYGVQAANASCYSGTPASDTMNPNSAVVQVINGAVPVRTLSLPDEFMYDGWGRKFRYSVTPDMTVSNAFEDSLPGDSCAISITDNSGNTMPIKAVYTLISYGRNGAGAYIKNGSQNDNPTSTPEQTNHFMTTGDRNSARVKNGVSGTGNTYYDDIVRFKTRYQLMDDIERMRSIYRGPDIAIGYNSTSTPQITLAKRICGRLEEFVPNDDIPVQSYPPLFLSFMPNSTHLFAYHSNGTNGLCKLYTISGHDVDEVGDTPLTCPDKATAAAVAKTNGTLVINTDAAPYARVYTWDAGSGQFTEVAGAFDDPLTSMPDNVSISENGDFITVSSSTEPYALLYIKDGAVWKARAALSDEPASPTVNAISPNGKYYIMGALSGTMKMYVWRNVDNSFTRINSVTTNPFELLGITAETVLKLGFSDDSRAAAMATGEGAGFIRINTTTDTMFGMTSSATSPTDNLSAYTFSKDGLVYVYGTVNTSSVDITTYVLSGGSSLLPTNPSLTNHSSDYVSALAAAR